MPHGDREEVETAQLRQIHRKHDVEQIGLDRRELARVHRAKHLHRVQLGPSSSQTRGDGHAQRGGFGAQDEYRPSSSR